MPKLLECLCATFLTLALTTNATAALVSYDIPYTPVGGQGTTFLDVEIFVETNEIPGIGTHDVVLDSFSILFSGAPYPTNPSFLYENSNTSPCTLGTFCGANATYVPVTGQFTNGMFTGFLRGFQPGPGQDPFYIRQLGFGFDTFGNVAEIIFFGVHPTKLNLGKDRALQGEISGPFAVVVPIPNALALFLIPLSILIKRGLRFLDRPS